MKKIKGNKLKKGMVVSDIKPGGIVQPIVLEFIKFKDDRMFFKHVSGPDYYSKSPVEKGLIGFTVGIVDYFYLNEEK